MPRGDGTGPMGFGPMTGRGAGYCAGYGMPGHANAGWGRGHGGRGRGWRHWYHATGLPGWARGRSAGLWGYAHPWPPAMPHDQTNARDDVEALREQAEYLEGALDSVRKRLDELEGSGEK